MTRFQPRGLLAAAAEVEHALLVEYLYAAYSLIGAAVQGPWNPSAARSVIIDIARHEMAHFVTVQNLLLAIKGGVHLDRKGADQQPFPFRLEPLRLASLARYVITEAPEPNLMTPEQLAIVDRAVMAVGGMQAAQNIKRVGMLYSRLFWMFQEDDTPADPDLISDPTQFNGIPHIDPAEFADPTALQPLQTDGTEWGAFPNMHILRATTKPQVRGVIQGIAAEGEGASGMPDSHFSKFLKLFDAADKLIQDVPNATLASDLAVDPTLDAAGSSGSVIASEPARTWAAISNLRYQIILLDMALSLSFPSNEPHGFRKLLAQDWSVSDMRFLRSIASTLVMLDRAAPTDTPRRTGPPFALLDPFPADELQRWKSLRDLMRTSVQLTAPLAVAGDTSSKMIASDQKPPNWADSCFEAVQSIRPFNPGKGLWEALRSVIVRAFNCRWPERSSAT